jgi:hypothetical protein
VRIAARELAGRRPVISSLLPWYERTCRTGPMTWEDKETSSSENTYASDGRGRGRRAHAVSSSPATPSVAEHFSRPVSDGARLAIGIPSWRRFWEHSCVLPR